MNNGGQATSTNCVRKGNHNNKDLLYQIDEEEDKRIELSPLVGNLILGENPDPPERDRLPFFKDPKIKFSVWTVIKDSIGKDLTKISLPVYFNMPVSALQMQTATCENLHLLDKAIAEKDPIRRLAIVTIYSMIFGNHFERANQKPFNPMLGETFEYSDPHGKFKMIAELTVHHPPIIAYHVEGASGYRRSSTLRPKPQFVKGAITVKNLNKDFIDLLPHKERFEI